MRKALSAMREGVGQRERERTNLDSTGAVGQELPTGRFELVLGGFRQVYCACVTTQTTCFQRCLCMSSFMIAMLCDL